MSELGSHVHPDITPAATISPMRAQQDGNIDTVSLVRATVAPGQAALSRMIGRGCRARLRSLDAVFTIQLGVGEPKSDWPAAIVLDGPAGPIEIEEGARLLRALTGIDIGPFTEMPDQHWEWFQSTLLGRLSHTLFSRCDRILRELRPAFADVTVLCVAVRTPHHMLTTHLRASTATWLGVLPRIDWVPEREPASHYLDLMFETVLQIARHTLPASALHALAEGDIVLPDTPYFDTDGQGWVSLGGRQTYVRYQTPGTLHILGSDGPRREGKSVDSGGDAFAPPNSNQRNKEQSMGDQYDDELAGAASAREAVGSALDTVEVDLNFELGKVKMSLGELRTLAAGSILLLVDASPESVAIVAGGRTLGRGEVVDVDGRLGIRIIHWGHYCE
jgi:type III secretion protein Q